MFSNADWCGAQPLPGFDPPSESRPRVKVEVFTTQTCEACKRFEKFLTEMKIPFIRYDLDRNTEARRDYYDNIGRGKIPVTRINGRTVIRGDEPAKVYRSILKQQESQPIAPQRKDEIFGLPPQVENPRNDQSGPAVRPKEEFALP